MKHKKNNRRDSVDIRILNSDGTDFTLPDGARVELIRQDPSTIELNSEMYTEANERRMTFSSLLETIDPSERGADGVIVGLDAYERQLQRYGIITRSNPAAGIHASYGERFFQSNIPGSSILFPEFINRQARMAMFEPDVVDEMIATTRPIDGDTYSSLLITWEEDRVLKKRVAQGAEFPEVTIAWSQTAEKLFKYGITINSTYEFVRRCPVDMLAKIFQIIIKQNRISETDDVIRVLRNGMAAGYQTNANGAGNEDPGSSIGGTPMNLSFRGYLSWAMRFFPYGLTTAIVNREALLTLVTMSKPGLDPFQVLASLQQGPQTIQIQLAQNFWQNLRVVYNGTKMPENKILGINKNYALERIVEIGSDLVETEKLISRQFNKIVISEAHGYSKILPQTIRELTLN